jgi:hypothetical protein
MTAISVTVFMPKDIVKCRERELHVLHLVKEELIEDVQFVPKTHRKIFIQNK